MGTWFWFVVKAAISIPLVQVWNSLLYRLNSLKECVIDAFRDVNICTPGIQKWVRINREYIRRQRNAKTTTATMSSSKPRDVGKGVKSEGNSAVANTQIRTDVLFNPDTASCEVRIWMNE